MMPPHGMFLECWNNTKSHPNICQRFSSLLVEGIAKICQKLKSYDGLLSNLQEKTVNPAHPAAIFCPILFCWQKLKNHKYELLFFCTVLKSFHQLDLKNVFKCCKDILWYSTNLETYRALSLPQTRRRLWTFPYVKFLVVWDVHRVKIQNNYGFWQVSRSCWFSLVLPLIVNLHRSKIHIVICIVITWALV